MSGRSAIGAAALILLATTMTAVAAGPFDGSWQGTGGADGVGCHDQDFTMTVANGAVDGVLARQRTSNQFPIKGTVSADGGFSGQIIGGSGTLPIRGRFTADGFTGGYKYKDCEYHITLKKAS